MKKKIYEIPVEWTMRGRLKVEASSLEEAVQYAKENIGKNNSYEEDSEMVQDSLMVESYDGTDDASVAEICSYLREFYGM